MNLFLNSDVGPSLHMISSSTWSLGKRWFSYKAKMNAAMVSLSLSLVSEQIRKLWHESLVIAAAVNNVTLALLHKADCISVCMNSSWQSQFGGLWHFHAFYPFRTLALGFAWC